MAKYGAFFIFAVLVCVLAQLTMYLLENNIFAVKSVEVDSISLNPIMKDVMAFSITFMIVTVAVILPMIAVYFFHGGIVNISATAQSAMHAILMIVLLGSPVYNFLTNGEKTDIVTMSYTNLNLIFMGIGLIHGITAVARNRLVAICSALVLATSIHSVGCLLRAPLAKIIGSKIQIYLSILVFVCLIMKTHTIYKVGSNMRMLKLGVRDIATVSTLAVVMAILTRSAIIPAIGLSFFAMLHIPGVGTEPLWYGIVPYESYPWTVILWTEQSLIISKCLQYTIPGQGACQLMIQLGLLMVIEVVIFILYSTSSITQKHLLDFMIVFVFMFSTLTLIEDFRLFQP